MRRTKVGTQLCDAATTSLRFSRGGRSVFVSGKRVAVRKDENQSHDSIQTYHTLSVMEMTQFQPKLIHEQFILPRRRALSLMVNVRFL